MAKKRRITRPVKTVRAAFEILGVIKDSGWAGVTAISKETGMAKSTVHRHLQTLEHDGYVVREGDTYRIGVKFMDLGIHARNRQPGFDIAQQKTAELAEKSGELCVFMVEEHGRGYLLCREKGPKAVKTGTRVGKPLYLHATAGGKSILAHSSRDRIEDILDRWGLPKRTAGTIASREELLDELDLIRDRGYSFNHEEHIDGLGAIAAPVFDGNEQVLGALCVSAPTKRMRNESLSTELREKLLETVNELELNITYS